MWKIIFCLLLYSNYGPFQFAMGVLPLNQKFLIVKNEQHRRLDKNTLKVIFSKSKNIIYYILLY